MQTVFHNEIAGIVLKAGIQNAIEYKVPPEVQSRAEVLLEKNRSQTLAEEEKEELDAFLFFGHIMRIAKIKALKIKQDEQLH